MKLVIVGNGVAGTTTARFVADRAPETEIEVYTDEPYLYYPRPRLIDLIEGKIAADDMPQYAEAWYQKRGIRVHLDSPVASLAPDTHTITLQDGSIVPYDKLVLANGAANFIPPFTGADLDGVASLRSLEDALYLRARSQAAAHTVILGGGLLGLDLAMALETNCRDVTVVELMPRLLPRQLDEQGAAMLTALVVKRGVQVITNDVCTQIKGDGKVEEVVLKSGRTLPTDLVAVSAGVCPNIGLAQAAGLACKRGIIVDNYLRTSAEDILAIGDVAEYNNRVWAIIPTALAQAKTAAASVLDDFTTAYEDIVPSTTLKVTGIDLTSIGEVNPIGDDFVELRQQDDKAGTYKKLVIRNGLVIGAILLGDRQNVRTVTTLIDKQVRIGGYEDRLFDPNLDITSLVH